VNSWKTGALLGFQVTLELPAELSVSGAGLAVIQGFNLKRPWFCLPG